MEVCSSTEMGAPGASHLGTGDHGPKTDRSRPRSVPVNALPVTLTGCRHLGDVLRPGLILDDGQLEPDHRTAVFAVWRKANPWGGATAGHTQIGLLAHITSGPPGIEQRILANFPFAHGPLAPPAA